MRAVHQQSPASMPFGSAPRRLLLTSSTAASLFGMFMLYAIAVRPLIKAPSLADGIFRAIYNVKSAPNEHAELAKKYLADQAWATDAAYQMSVDNGAIIFFENWERGEENNTVHFKPFAMIWMQKGQDPAQEPICIVSDSARVEFARKFDFPNPQPGRVIGGALEGAVHITGADNLTLSGRNFHFTEEAMSVWCDTDVNFTYQQNSGTAHGMQLELIADEAARKQDRFAASGVRKVTLQQNVVMNLVSEPERPKGKPKRRAPVDVNVRSMGSFSFVIETNTATFEEQVNVRAIPRDKPQNVDELQCDLLSLVFARKPKDGAKPPAEPAKPTEPAEQKTAAKTSPRFRTIGGNMSFQRLSAHSSQGNEVKLASKGNNLTAWMTRLIYDGETKIAELTSDSNVRVLQESSEIQAPKIELVHNDDNDITHFSCRGAGWLKNVDPKTQQIQLTAEWQQEMRKYPDPHSNLDILEFEKQAVVRQPGEDMGLAAEFIRLWFQRQTRKQRAEASKARRSGESLGARPKRLLAENNVALISPQMQAQGNRLEAWFSEGRGQPDSTTQQDAGRSKAPETKTAAVKAGPSADIQEPGDSKSNAPAPAKQDERQLDGPLHVRADLIRVLVVIFAERRGAQVSEVWTKGNVDVKQQRKGSLEPLQITGETMRVVNRSAAEQTIIVQGAPAHIRSTEMHIEGQEVNFDRVKNLAWVTGAGLLELPVTQDLEGNKLPSPELMSIWWTKEMTFDGKQAEFLGNVRTVLRENVMRCAKMQATTSRRYSFTEEPPKGADNMEIETVHCDGGVEFESQRYEGTKVAEQRQGKFAEFLMNRKSGDTSARGPGYILSWQRGHGRRAGFVPAATVRANAGSVSNNSEWEFSRIDFSRSMTGNINQQSTTFQDRVEIIYGPVEQPQQTIDLDERLPEGGGWMRCATLCVTRRKNTEHPDGFVELLGKGNAELEGQTFFAQADEVTYDESKGLYTLRAEGNHKAIISQQKKVGGKQSDVVAQRIEFIPAKNLAKIVGSTGSGGDF
ncbi:MAG: hypothetical protein WD648_16240 [Planctomycetaceae bacterium]